MEKEHKTQNNKNILIVLSLLFVSILVLSVFAVPLASAGWLSDFWGKITGNVVDNSTIADVTPPIISNGKPVGTITTDTATLSVDTNENADCAFSYDSGNMPYENMLKFFATHAMHHEQLLGTGSPKSSVVYIRCKDFSGNVNVQSYKIAFDVAPTNVTQTCIDSEGYNTSLEGKTYGIYPNGTAYVYYDFCGVVGNNPCLLSNLCDTPSNANYSREYICQMNNNQPAAVIEACPYGCKSNGACLSTSANATTTCTDSDSGLNYYTKGAVSASNMFDGSDSCIFNQLPNGTLVNTGKVSEHYCLGTGLGSIEDYRCPYGCSDGACITAPINATPTPTCTSLSLTFANDKTVYAQGEDVMYTWTCIPSGSAQYVEMQVVKPNGTAITYNSASGGNTQTFGFGTSNLVPGDYTLNACFSIDCSQDPTASLKFSVVQSTNTIANVTETMISGKGFRKAFWQCYNGEEQSQGVDSSCKSSEIWQSYAKEFCKNKCYTDGSKCGVNSFSITDECYLESNVSKIVNETPSVPIEGLLICKDSCPLDGKCYPLGYRKSGEFCSDNGAFVEQSAGDITCDNNFECSSNVCVSNKCVSPGFIQSIINWFKKLFGG